ncbi:MAG: hypothetical protein ACRBCS_15640 [Cellvibrionaceae bacterium]
MFAVIDLGSNSFHLLIADHSDIGDSPGFSVIYRCSEKIQLAEGIAQTGQLCDAAIERGIQCLRHFKLHIDKHSPSKIQVVATQALRQASNASLFIDLAKQEGFDIEVISGEREAALIYRGISDPLDDTDGNRLIIDIGGGSTEIAVGKNRNAIFTTSLPMGCVVWRDRFFSNNKTYAENSVNAKAAAAQCMQPVIEDIKNIGWSSVYSSSGSSKMLSYISSVNAWGNGEITPQGIAQVEAIINPVSDMSTIQLEGLNPNRVDLLAPGISILSTIMGSLNVDRLEHSRTALREGILSDMSGHRVNYHLTN